MSRVIALTGLKLLSESGVLYLVNSKAAVWPKCFGVALMDELTVDGTDLWSVELKCSVTIHLMIGFN